MKGKKCVYTLNEVDICSWNLMEGEKNLECLSHTDDTKGLKVSLPMCHLYAHRAGKRFREELPGAQSPREYRGEAGNFHITPWELWIRRGAEGTESLLSLSTMPERVSHIRNMIKTLQTDNTDRQIFSLWVAKEAFYWMSWTVMKSHLPWLYFRRFR